MNNIVIRCLIGFREQNIHDVINKSHEWEVAWSTEDTCLRGVIRLIYSGVNYPFSKLKAPYQTSFGIKALLLQLNTTYPEASNYGLCHTQHDGLGDSEFVPSRSDPLCTFCSHSQVRSLYLGSSAQPVAPSPAART